MKESETQIISWLLLTTHRWASNVIHSLHTCSSDNSTMMWSLHQYRADLNEIRLHAWFVLLVSTENPVMGKAAIVPQLSYLTLCLYKALAVWWLFHTGHSLVKQLIRLRCTQSTSTLQARCTDSPRLKGLFNSVAKWHYYTEMMNNVLKDSL